MNPAWTVAKWGIIAAIALAGVILLAAPALPDERSEWLKSLVVPPGAPDAGRKCCDVSDGFPAEADYRNGQWFAKPIEGGRYPVPEQFKGRWIPVPPNIVLRNVQMIDAERAYLFIWQGKLRCFVPPLQGF